MRTHGETTTLIIDNREENPNRYRHSHSSVTLLNNQTNVTASKTRIVAQEMRRSGSAVTLIHGEEKNKYLSFLPVRKFSVHKFKGAYDKHNPGKPRWWGGKTLLPELYYFSTYRLTGVQVLLRSIEEVICKSYIVAGHRKDTHSVQLYRWTENC